MVAMDANGGTRSFQDGSFFVLSRAGCFIWGRELRRHTQHLLGTCGGLLIVKRWHVFDGPMPQLTQHVIQLLILDGQ